MLVEVKACGICGSDLHFAKHGATCSTSCSRCGAPRTSAGTSTCTATCSWATSSAPRCSRSGPTPNAPGREPWSPRSRCCCPPTGFEHHRLFEQLLGGYGERMLFRRRCCCPSPTALTPSKPRSPSRWRSGCTRSTGPLSSRARGPVPRLRADRHRHDRGPAPTWHGDRSWRPTTRRCDASSLAVDGRPPGGRPGRGLAVRRRRHGGPGWSSRRSGCPASSTTSCGAAPAGTRLVVVGVCMQRRHGAPVLGHRQGDQRAFVFGYDPTSSPTRCARSPRARSTSPR